MLQVPIEGLIKELSANLRQQLHKKDCLQIKGFIENSISPFLSFFSVIKRLFGTYYT